MSNEQWIDNAFEKAKKEAVKARETAEHIRKFLDENTMAILDKWKMLVGDDTSERVAKLLHEDEELCEAFETMSETFFIAGAIYGKIVYGRRDK